LAASVPKAALPFLINDIDDFSFEIKGTDCKNLLLFFYYGGMICAALKKFKEAIYFFEAAIQVPASTLSHVMLESYKKLILVSLILTGEVPQSHKCANQIVNRVLKPNAAAYTDIAASFVTFNPTELSLVINRHHDTINRDKNYGLVKQVKAAQTKLSILRLTKTFLTLSLADVASRVQLPGGAQQAESMILSMIQDGEIYAKINQKDGMVVFLDCKEKYDGPLMNQKIENQIIRCIDLNKRLESMNDNLATNPDYISKVLCASEDEGISSSKQLFSV
jgi:COP9 signalosome complex subunit 3